MKHPGNVVLKMIREAQRERLKELDFSNFGLKVFPTEILTLKHLERLRLRNNNLDSIPESLGQLSNLISLDLNCNRLRVIPQSIFSLEKLEDLNLCNNLIVVVDEAISNLERLISLHLNSNKIGVLPDAIGTLRNLSLLDVSHNVLRNLPSSCSKLENLKWLDLKKNRISVLPAAVTDLHSLVSLNLNRNRLGHLPPQILGLSNLKKLDLSDNQLTDIPELIGQLRQLTWLDLSKNRLRQLPASVAQITSLSYLSIGANEIETLPSDLSPLAKLHWLDVSRNRLKALPPSLCHLSKLSSLSVLGNPLETPPKEVVRHGLQAINNYFKQIEVDGKDRLYEAKILILGEGGAGKTTLARKIEDPKYELQEEDSTKGIEIVRWNFLMEDGQSFRTSIWDFGGQEIYHATHQFFLTRRSLYLLVADTRREDTDFYYWLNVIELLSDNSPLLVVKNEKQDRRQEINENQFRGEFTNYKETISTNLATNRGLHTVITEVKHYAQNLPHVGAELPKTWVRVREALENEPKNYISLVDFFDLCDQHGFTALEDKLQLSSYLHDLGICLHFQEDPLLMKTVILRPKWGTDAVYKVLDNEQVRANLGKFTKPDLAGIWQHSEYDGMRNELLQLMMNFKLCYKIPNSDLYIAPQLLSENQPKYFWDESNNLVLRYSYEFMPKGILTQFIVAMHRAIFQDCVWKSGVIIEKDGARAEVIEYYGKREIRIRVTGKQKKELSTIVTYEIDKIHDTYRRLKFSKLIPCNCFRCANRQDPHFYPFEILRQFYADGERYIQCQKSYQMVGVTQLIDEVTNRSELARESTIISRQSSKQVFISYSHADVEWLTRIDTMLKPLTRDHIISTWADTKIQSGTKWQAEIELALASSNAALLIVSPHFLASDFIVKHELPALLSSAQKGGLTILWIAVSDSLYAVSDSLYKDTEIAEYQAVHDPSQPLDSLPPAEQNRILLRTCERIKQCLDTGPS